MDTDTTPPPLKGGGGCLSVSLPLGLVWADTTSDMVILAYIHSADVMGRSGSRGTPLATSGRVSYIGGMVQRSQQVEDEIIARLQEGETLMSICRSRHMPLRAAVYEWMKLDPEFDERIARARQVGFDKLAEETIEIIDTPPERAETLGGSRIDTGFVSWQKNRVDHRLKLLAKWYPERYGDKQAVTVANKEGETFKTEVDGGALAVELAKAMRALKGGEDECD